MPNEVKGHRKSRNTCETAKFRYLNLQLKLIYLELKIDNNSLIMSIKRNGKHGRKKRARTPQKHSTISRLGCSGAYGAEHLTTL